jgi:hypothetical protein
MGAPEEPRPAKMVVGILAASQETIEDAKSLLELRFGRIDLTSEIIPFSHSSYYAEEMGSSLHRLWVSHDKLISPAELARKKLETNEMEESRSVAGRRRINLDPGYLTGSTFVLATTKEAAHRVYLGEGIYGEVTLLYQHQSWKVLDWTYPDYREETSMGFLEKVRNRYLEQLKGD